MSGRKSSARRVPGTQSVTTGTCDVTGEMGSGDLDRPGIWTRPFRARPLHSLPSSTMSSSAWTADANEALTLSLGKLLLLPALPLRRAHASSR